MDFHCCRGVDTDKGVGAGLPFPGSGRDRWTEYRHRVSVPRMDPTPGITGCPAGPPGAALTRRKDKKGNQVNYNIQEY